MEGRILETLNYQVNDITIAEMIESYQSIYNLNKKDEKAMIFGFLYLLENLQYINSTNIALSCIILSTPLNNLEDLFEKLHPALTS